MKSKFFEILCQEVSTSRKKCIIVGRFLEIIPDMNKIWALYQNIKNEKMNFAEQLPRLISSAKVKQEQWLYMNSLN